MFQFVPTFWFFSTMAFDTVVLMRLLLVPTQRGLGLPDVGRVGRRQVGIDVVGAVDVLAVDVFERPDPAAWQRWSMPRLVPPNLGELEVRVCQRQLEARRGRAGDGRGFVALRVGAERPRRRDVELLEPRQHARVADWLEIQT